MVAGRKQNKTHTPKQNSRATNPKAIKLSKSLLKIKSKLDDVNLTFKKHPKEFANLYFCRFGTTESLVHFNPELKASSNAISFQDCSSGCGVHAAILLIVHIHGRKSHNVLLQRWWCGIHFMKISCTWFRFKYLICVFFHPSSTCQATKPAQLS